MAAESRDVGDALFCAQIISSLGRPGHDVLEDVNRLRLWPLQLPTGLVL